MANEEHLARLQQGVDTWNQWREMNLMIKPDLGGANLHGMNLIGADLRMANFFRANLTGAQLTRASFTGAELTKANLTGADLTKANLTEADLTKANLTEADLFQACLARATLRQADLYKAALWGALLWETDFEGANLSGCSVYGIAAWNINLAGAQQANLVITRPNEPVITVDNLEVAQFVYLLLHNEKIREVIDTIAKKAVLILGRFTPERKAVLDAIREELRRRNYLPILFDFEKPASRDLTETISTLAHMARFIIADLTEPSSLPKELEAIKGYPDLTLPGLQCQETQGFTTSIR